jgi:AcrR family transcriptional regulator
VFCREGYAGANIDMIAAEAGVSRQTIYNHHGDKEKLFVAVVKTLTARATAGIVLAELHEVFPERDVVLARELT